jgi:hypothetical protein
MPETSTKTKRSPTPDWFVHGILTKIGDTFDRFLGRGWKPSSNLATSELIERLKALLDAEVKETPTKAKFVPHNITLKMQWDKFSTDAEAALRTLENELLAAAVDHINDRRYYTYAPLSIRVKPDYFSTGVKLYAGFESFDENGREGEVNVTLPGMRLDQELLAASKPPVSFEVLAKFEIGGRAIVKQIEMAEGQRVSVGRTKENALTIDDPSVSKIHASLMLNQSHQIVVADTGSTNGTFINDSRIAYGKATELTPSDTLKFGTVEVAFELVRVDDPGDIETEDDGSYKVGDFEFTRKAPAMSDSNPANAGAGKPEPEYTAPISTPLKPEPEDTK